MAILKALLKQKTSLICLGFIFFIFILGCFAPFFSPYDPLSIDISNKLAPPSLSHLLGTDYLGRDILSRLIYAIRISVFVPILTIALTIFISLILGIVAGYFRLAGGIIMRICDCFLAFPSELLILCLVGFMGAGLSSLIIATIIAKTAWHTRMIYNFSLEYVGANFINFAKVNKTSSLVIIFKHILPCILGDVLLLATMDISWVILSLSALSFLGLGAQPPLPEWGSMLNEAKELLALAPALCLPAGICILLVVLAFSFLGDALAKAMDKRQRDLNAI